MRSRAWPAGPTGTSRDHQALLLPKFRLKVRRRERSLEVRLHGARCEYPSPHQPTVPAFAQCRGPSGPGSPRPQFADPRAHLSNASTFRGCRTTCCQRSHEYNRCSVPRHQHRLLLQPPKGRRHQEDLRFAQNHGRSFDTQRCVRRMNGVLDLT